MASPRPALAVALAEVAADLRALEVPFAVVGGLAVSARAEPRLTRDVDVAVAAPDDALAEQTIRALLARGYRLVMSVEQTRTGRLSTARFKPSDKAGLLVDLLFASSGIEPEIVEQAEELEILPGLIVPVARTGHLVAMKLLARDDRERPQDLDDLRALMPAMDRAEHKRLEAALALIQRRGFSRGRDLVQAWKDLTSKRRRP